MDGRVGDKLAGGLSRSVDRGADNPAFGRGIGEEAARLREIGGRVAIAPFGIFIHDRGKTV